MNEQLNLSSLILTKYLSMSTGDSPKGAKGGLFASPLTCENMQIHLNCRILFIKTKRFSKCGLLKQKEARIAHVHVQGV